MTETTSSLVPISGDYIHSLSIVVEDNITDSTKLFAILDTEITNSVREREEQNLRLCALLAYANVHWSSFSMELVGPWKYNFYIYAQSRTGGYQRGTIDNMVDTGKTFLLGQLPDSIPEEVELYDAKGNPTGEMVNPREQLSEQSASKLLVAKGAAKNGRLSSNPVAMGQLFNPEVSVHILSDTIQGRVQLPALQDSFQLRLVGSYIVGIQNGEEKVVAELVEDTDPIAVKGREYILAACRITEIE